MNAESVFHSVHPLGPLSLHVWHTDDGILRSELSSEEARLALPSGLSERIQQQVGEYLDKTRTQFDLPLNLQGTRFQCQVWQQLLAIPVGQTRTYGSLAAQLQTAAQPVGGACRHNRIPFFIPCHRVVAQSGIGGFSGEWGMGTRIDGKRWLLAHEGVAL
ncbi:methylated-DNA--[protein]-cysteine S-methyltransferase [Aliidiomarina sp. Khilg15.8]